MKNNELAMLSDLMDDVMRILPDNVEADISVEKLASRNLIHIYISDLKFYLEDLRFKKFSKVFKKKYKKLYFIFSYRGDVF